MAASPRWQATCDASIKAIAVLIALPVFPLRNFTARDLMFAEDGVVRAAADLRGKRVGIYDWVASGSIWYRHFLHYIGVPPEELRWTHWRGG